MKGAIPIEKRTISGRTAAKHSLPHNNREFLCENTQPTRTKDNITIIKDDIRQVYHELFDKALTEYNAKQKRKNTALKQENSSLKSVRDRLTIASLQKELSESNKRYQKVMDFIRSLGLVQKLEEFLHPKKTYAA